MYTVVLGSIYDLRTPAPSHLQGHSQVLALFFHIWKLVLVSASQEGYGDNTESWLCGRKSVCP